MESKLQNFTMPLGYQQIASILPHRYPFLLVDRVSEVVPGERICAHKNVSANEPFVNGHFPGLPLMPGVLQIEALAQAAGILAYFGDGFDPATQVGLLAGVEDARFRRPVSPGDCLDLNVSIVSQRKTLFKAKGFITSQGQSVCEATLLAVIKDR